MADTPRLTIRCEYPDTDLLPTEVTFRLSPSYGRHTGHEANEWFIEMMYQHEEFDVETDKPGEPPMPCFNESPASPTSIRWNWCRGSTVGNPQELYLL